MNFVLNSLRLFHFIQDKTHLANFLLFHSLTTKHLLFHLRTTMQSIFYLHMFAIIIIIFVKVRDSLKSLMKTKAST